MIRCWLRLLNPGEGATLVNNALESENEVRMQARLFSLGASEFTSYRVFPYPYRTFL